MTSAKSLAARAACVSLAALGFTLAAAPARAQPCEPWNGRSEIRCLASVVVEEWIAAGLAGNSQTFATVTVQNRHASHPVHFKYQLWQSICNISGTSLPEAEATLQPGDALHIDLHPKTYTVSTGGTAADVPHEGGGLGFNTVVHAHVCTEFFFFACTADGNPIQCADVLGASIVEPPLQP